MRRIIPSRSASHRRRTLAGPVVCAIETMENRRLFSSIVVNTVLDQTDASGSGTISLRDAIATADSSASATTISFDPSVFASAQTIVLTQGTRLEMSQPTTIVGPASGITVSGNAVTRSFFVDSGAAVSMSGLTVTDGHGNDNNGDGGGIYVSSGGTLSLTDVTLSGNTGAQGSHGGGLANYGTADLTDVAITGNTVTVLSSTTGSGEGGGIFNQGQMTVEGGSISNNSSGKAGGGIFNGGTLNLSGTSIDANSGTSGGGIYNIGTLNVSNAIIDDNASTFGGGAGVNNAATVTVTNTTIANNDSVGHGGGLENYGAVTGSASAKLSDDAITGNSSTTTASDGGGGGIASDVNGLTGTTTLTLNNVTVANNTSQTIGGGIYLDSSNTATAIFGVTDSGNTSAGDGGGLEDTAAAGAAIGNTIIAGNSTTGGSGPDVSGAVASQGHNLIGQTDASSGWTAADLTGTTASPRNADLGALGNNGGSTETLLPLTGSPAIGGGSVALIPSGTNTDQRGLPRTVNNAVDIGAVEVQSNAQAATVSTLKPSANIFPVGDSCYLTCTVVTATGTGPAPTGTITIEQNGIAKMTETLSNRTVTFQWTALEAGSSALDSFVYSGDSSNAPSTSNTIDQWYPALSQLSATTTRAVIPSANVAGQPLNARVPVSFKNTGSTLTGTYTIVLYADTSTGGLSGNQVALETVTRRTTLRANRSLALTLVAKKAPASLLAGTYYLLAEVTDPLGNVNIVNTSQTIAVSAPFVALSASALAVEPTTVAVNRLGSTLITLTNTGNVSATGSLVITLVPSTDGVSAVPGVVLTTLARRVTVRSGSSGKYLLRFKIPAVLAAGSYYPLADVSLVGVSVTAAGSSPFTAG